MATANKMITTTKVWKVNNRLVVADTAINAIMIYTDYFGSQYLQ